MRNQLVAVIVINYIYYSYYQRYYMTFPERWEGLAQDGRREKYGSLIEGPARFPTAKQGEVEGEEWSPLVHRHCDPSVTFA